MYPRVVNDSILFLLTNYRDYIMIESESVKYL